MEFRPGRVEQGQGGVKPIRDLQDAQKNGGIYIHNPSLNQRAFHSAARSWAAPESYSTANWSQTQEKSL